MNPLGEEDCNLVDGEAEAQAEEDAEDFLYDESSSESEHSMDVECHLFDDSSENGSDDSDFEGIYLHRGILVYSKMKQCSNPSMRRVEVRKEQKERKKLLQLRKELDRTRLIKFYSDMTAPGYSPSEQDKREREIEFDITRKQLRDENKALIEGLQAVMTPDFLKIVDIALVTNGEIFDQFSDTDSN